MKEFTKSGYLRMLEHSGLDPVRYFWSWAEYESEDEKKPMANIQVSEESCNEWIGKRVKLEFSGRIRCVDCGRLTSKSFNQGSCYPCFTNLAKNDMCILRPNECHFHLGTCREPEWGETYCFREHTVYLAVTSGMKVGITKENPVSNRWVDQGAEFGLPFLKCSSRRDAGILEAEFSKWIADKTQWQVMVSTASERRDLHQKAQELLDKIEMDDLGIHADVLEEEIQDIHYPVQEYPKKPKRYSLKKDGLFIEDRLLGIKGQYLLFEKGVLNVRSLGGYFFNLSVSPI